MHKKVRLNREYNYTTTKVSFSQTVGQIKDLLAAHGVTKIAEMTDFNEKETRSTISGEELIGAEIIAVIPFGLRRKDKIEELAEIEIRLKDGRHLNLPAGREEIQIMELWENNLSHYFPGFLKQIKNFRELKIIEKNYTRSR